MGDPEETPLAPSESFSSLKSEIVERGVAEPTKRKPGRPKGSTTKPRISMDTPPAPPVEMIPIETMVEIVALPFDIYSARRGPHWKLSKEEKEQIGKLANRVIGKWSPEWMQRFGDEIALGTVLGMAILARVMQDIALMREDEKKIIDVRTVSPLSNPGYVVGDMEE